MVLIIFSAVLITVSVSIIFASSSIRDESLAKWQSETALQAFIMNEWLEDHKATANAVAMTLAFTDDSSEENLFYILNTAFKSNSVFEDVYIGFSGDVWDYPAGMSIMGSGFPIVDLFNDETRADGGWRAYKRPWYEAAVTDVNAAHIIRPYVDSNTEQLCISVSRAVVRDGVLIGVVAIDILLPFLTEQTLAATAHEDGASMLLYNDGDILIHGDPNYAPNAKGEFNNLRTFSNNAYSEVWNRISANDGVYRHKGPDGRYSYYASGTLHTTGWHMVTVLPERVIGEVMMQSFTATMLMLIPVVIVILIIAALIILYSTKKAVTKPIHELITAAESISNGDIKIEGLNAGSEPTNNEIILLERAFSKMLKSFKQQAKILTRVAEGDYTLKVETRSDKDIINLAINRMVEETLNVLHKVATAGIEVADGSKQISSGAQVLAQGSAEQAETVRELSSSMSEIAVKTKENSDMADRAANLADKIKNNAEKGSTQMSEMMDAVKEINQASQSISKVIKVIDDIAFQTNILALNAAVEAARAGQHGKGFAVVAEEVRNLASKSAEAAKDTGGMISNSMEKAELGSRIAAETAASLDEIVSGIKESNQIINSMAVSSNEQYHSINQINEGVERVANIVQQNSITAAESASASQEMSDQSEMLEKLIAQFQLRDIKLSK
jgi:methyl-accepting chemotaxis protein